MVYLQKKQDRVAYLKGMVVIAKADGIIAPEEVDYIEAATIGMGLNEDEKKEIRGMWTSKNETEIKFSDKANAAFFIQEATQLAYIDGNYDETERKSIYLLGEKVGLSHDEVERIESWVEEGLKWKERGEALILEIAGE